MTTPRQIGWCTLLTLFMLLGCIRKTELGSGLSSSLKMFPRDRIPEAFLRSRETRQIPAFHGRRACRSPGERNQGWKDVNCREQRVELDAGSNPARPADEKWNPRRLVARVPLLTVGDPVGPTHATVVGRVNENGVLGELRVLESSGDPPNIVTDAADERMIVAMIFPVAELVEWMEGKRAFVR